MLPEILEDALKIGFTKDKELIFKVLSYLKSIIKPVEYKQWVELYQSPLGSVCCRFDPAGHILGSAYITFRIDDSKDRHETIVFSGDLGASNAPLLPEAVPPVTCDRLVIESTYGDTVHEGRKDRAYRLKQVLNKCLEDKGVVLIPAFSIGRTQELLYEIEDILHGEQQKKSGQPPDWEIVVDSPLAAKFTQHYRRLAEFWDKEAQDRRHAGRHPLDFEQLVTIDDHEAHKAFLNRCRNEVKPRIIIAGSGMCNGGRILSYLKSFLDSPAADILFVGYQAKGTIGRNILEYGPKGGWVNIDDRRYTIKCGVYRLSGYSAHADQTDLLKFVAGISEKPSAIRIVHGDDEAKITLQNKLRAMLPGCEVVIPGS